MIQIEIILIVSPNKSKVISIKTCHFNHSIIQSKKLKIKTYHLSSSKQKEEEKIKIKTRYNLLSQ